MSRTTKPPPIRVEVVVRPECGEAQRHALRAMASAAVDRVWQQSGLPLPETRERLLDEQE